MEATKPKATISQAVKEMPLEEAVVFLGQVCEFFQKRINLKQGPPGIRGERGEASTVPGPVGPSGRDGLDGFSARMRIGKVMTGDTAHAELELEEEPDLSHEMHGAGRVLPPVCHVLNLILPRGEKGDPSTVCGPAGPAGRTPTHEEVKQIVREVLSENLEQFRGSRGERGIAGPVGPAPTHDEIKQIIREVVSENLKQLRGPHGERGETGASGRDGMTREEITQIINDVLRDFSVLTEQTQKLITLHAQIHAWEKEADARHITLAQRWAKQADKICGDLSFPTPPPPPPPIAAPVAQTPIAPAPMKKSWLQKIFS